MMRSAAVGSAIFLQSRRYLRGAGIDANTRGMWPGKVHDYSPQIAILLWMGEESVDLAPRYKRFHIKRTQHRPFLYFPANISGYVSGML